MAINEQQLAIEERMLSSFWEQAIASFDLEAIPHPTTSITKAGAELELFLFAKDGTLATDAQKCRVLANSHADVELGACATELHPDPVNLHQEGFTGWLAQLREEEGLLKQAAKAESLLVGRCGTIPWAPIHAIERTQNVLKYQLVPDFHNQHRPNTANLQLGPLTLPGAEAVALLNSFQFTIEAANAADSLDKANRLLLIAPSVVALGAHASHLDGVDTGWKDCRMEVWQRTHDLRTPDEIVANKPLRVGLPNEYWTSMCQYLEAIAQHPFIQDKPEVALPVGIGEFWSDARIKKFGEKYAVEFRPISIQPSAMEDIALAAFTIGRMTFSQHYGEDFLPMEMVRRNKLAAEKNGLRAVFETQDGKVPAVKQLKMDLTMAKYGLMIAGILDKTASEALDLLQDRVEQVQVPADRLMNLNKRGLIKAVTAV